MIWSWTDEESGKQHRHLLAPQLEYIFSLLEKHFDCIEVIEYKLSKTRKAIIARSKKQKQLAEIGSVNRIQTK